MKWSKLKVLAEDFICEALQGRVHYQAVVHRKSHDQTSSFRVTLDGEEIFRASDITFAREEAVQARELREQRQLNPFPYDVPWQEWSENPDYIAYHQAYADAEATLNAEAIAAAWDIKQQLFDYIHMPLEEALRSTHPFIRAVALFDRRFGKRRLMTVESENEVDLVKRFLQIRWGAEGIVPIRKEN